MAPGKDNKIESPDNASGINNPEIRKPKETAETSDFLANLETELSNISPDRFLSWTEKLPSVLSSFVIPEYAPEKDIAGNSEVLTAVQSFTPILMAKLLLVETDPEIKKQLEAGNILEVLDKIDPTKLTPKEQQIVGILKAVQKKPNSPAAVFLREKMLPKIIGDALKIKTEGAEIANAVRTKEKPTVWNAAAKFIQDNPAIVVTGLIAGAGIIGYAAYNYFSNDEEEGAQSSKYEGSDPIEIAKNKILGGPLSTLLTTGLIGGLSLGGLYAAGKILDTAEVRLMLKDNMFSPDQNRLTQALIHFSNLRLADGMYTLANGADPEQKFTEAKAEELHINPFVMRLMGQKKLGTLLSEQETVLPKYAVESLSWPAISSEYFAEEKKIRENLKALNPKPTNLDITYSEYLKSHAYNLERTRDNNLIPNTANEKVNAARKEKGEKISNQKTRRLEIRTNLEKGEFTKENQEYIKLRSIKIRQEFDEVFAASPGFLDKVINKMEFVLPETFTRDANETDQKYYQELNTQIKAIYKEQGLELDSQIQESMQEEFAKVNYLINLEDIGERSLTETETKHAKEGLEAFGRLESSLTEITSNLDQFEEQEQDIANQRPSELLTDTGEVIDAIGFTTIWGIPMQAYLEAKEGNTITASVYAIPSTIGAAYSMKHGYNTYKKGGGIGRILLASGGGFVKGQTLGAYKMVSVPLGLAKDATKYLAPKLFPRFSRNPGLSFVEGKMNLDDLQKHINNEYRLKGAYDPNIEVPITNNVKATMAEVKQVLNNTHPDPARAKVVRDAILEHRFGESLRKGRLVRYSHKGKTALVFMDEIKANEKLAKLFIKDPKLARKLLTPSHHSLGYLSDFMELHKKHGDALVQVIEENADIKKAVTSRNRNLLTLMSDLEVGELDQIKSLTKPETVATLVKINGKNTIVTFEQMDAILKGSSNLDETLQTGAVNKYVEQLLTYRGKSLEKLKLPSGQTVAMALNMAPEKSALNKLLLQNPDLFDHLTSKKGLKTLESLLGKIAEAKRAGNSVDLLAELSKRPELLNALTHNDSYALKFIKELEPASQIGIKAEFTLFNPQSLRQSLRARAGDRIRELMSVFPKASEEFKALIKIQNNPKLLAAFNKGKIVFTAKNWPRVLRVSKALSKGAGVTLPALGMVVSSYQANEAWNKSKYIEGEDLADDLAAYRAAEAGIDLVGLAAPAVLVKLGVFATYGEALAAAGPVALAVAPVAITLGYMMEQTEESSSRWKITTKQWNEKLKSNKSGFYEELTKLSKRDVNFTDNFLGLFSESLEDNVDVANINTRRNMWEAVTESLAPSGLKQNVIDYVNIQTKGQFNFHPYQSGNLFQEALNYAMLLKASSFQKDHNKKHPNNEVDHLIINGNKILLKDIQPINAAAYINGEHAEKVNFAKIQTALIDLKEQTLTDSIAHELLYNENPNLKSIASLAVSQYYPTSDMFLGSLSALIKDNADSDDFTPEAQKALHIKYYNKLLRISESKLKGIEPTPKNIPKMLNALLQAQDSFHHINSNLYESFKHLADETTGDYDVDDYNEIIKAQLEA